jgi:hypothetical protein
MITPITSAIQPDPTATASSQKPTQSQPPSNTSTITDTVSISSAAKAALQEVTETQVQTIKEAQSGNLQAQKLLAKEEAAKKAEQ